MTDRYGDNVHTKVKGNVYSFIRNRCRGRVRLQVWQHVRGPATNVVRPATWHVWDWALGVAHE